jgi:hypothetical protein
MTAIAIESRVRSFEEDNRGAIMVIGIFFACMMIGWMWMVVGLGDAFIWRDRSQEAADAVTYSSSAIQAKAMNLISFLNLIMLVITFIYLIMAFLWNILDIVHSIFGSTDDGGCCQSSADARKNDCTVVATILEIIPYTSAIGQALNQFCSKWDTIADYTQKIQGRYSGHNSGLAKILGPYEKDAMAKFMPVLSTIEDVAGYGAPWAGEVVGIYVASQYKDWNQPRYGGALSATLVPGKLTPFATKWNTDSKESCKGAGEGNTSGGCETTQDANGGSCGQVDQSGCQQVNGTTDYREGLPVEITEEGMSDLCYIGAKMIGSGLSDAVSNIPVIGTVIGYLIDSFSSSLRDTYCEPSSQGFLEGAFHDLMLNFPATGLRFWTWVQDGGTNNSEQCPNNNWNVDSGGGSDGCGGGPDDCRGVYQIKMSNGSDEFWHDRDKAGGPHLVVEYAENGNDWFQVWSFVTGYNRPEQSEKLVGVAGMDSNPGGTWNKVIPQNSETAGFFNMYVAQSEFYYDCTAKWSESDCNDDYSKASFNMNWRARMRRIRGLSWKQDLFQYISGGSLGNNFNDWASQWFQVGSKGGTQSLLGQFGSYVTNSISSGAFGDLKTWAANKVGGAINPATAIPDIIH